VVIGSSSVTSPGGQTQQTPLTTAVIGGKTYTLAEEPSEVVVNGLTATEGGAATVINGQTISAGSGIVVVGSSTITLPTSGNTVPPPTTTCPESAGPMVSGATISAGTASIFVAQTVEGLLMINGSIRFFVGGPATTVYGVTVSAAPGAVVVDGRTQSVSAVSTIPASCPASVVAGEPTSPMSGAVGLDVPRNIMMAFVVFLMVLWDAWPS
jgi:hypothetical protein